jgi:hypothetical protein
VFFFPGGTTGPGGLGPLTSVCISHDDSGDSPNWQLERVEVTDTGIGRIWVFPCHAWIGKDKVGAGRGEHGAFVIEVDCVMQSLHGESG